MTLNVFKKESGSRQTIQTIHFIYSEAHNWSPGFPCAPGLWFRPFGVHLKVLQRLRLGIRSLVLYFSLASNDIQGVVTNYYPTMGRR